MPTGGGDLTVSLERTEAGLVLHSVVGPDNPVQRVPLPDGLGEPELMVVPLTTVEAPAFAVRGVRDGLSRWTVVGYRNGAATMLAPPGDVPLVSGPLDDGRVAETWLSEEGLLYSALVAAGAAGGRSEVHPWLPDAGDELGERWLGTWCLAFADGGGDGDTAGRC